VTGIDLPLALAIIGLGILIVIAPSTVPGLTPPTWKAFGGASRPGCFDNTKGSKP
jgi:hypothetical protein